MREMGINVPVVGSMALIGGSDFLSIAGKSAENLYIASSTPAYLHNEDQKFDDFLKHFQAIRGETPGPQHMYVARAYDAVLLVAKTAQSCNAKSTPVLVDCIRDELFTVKNYEGTSGTLTFDRAGDVSTPYSLLQLQQGVFRILP